MTFQMFPEISLVKGAPHLRGLAGSLYQAGAAQSEEDRFVVAGVAPHYFAQPCDQVAFIVNPERSPVVTLGLHHRLISAAPPALKTCVGTLGWPLAKAGYVQ